MNREEIKEKVIKEVRKFCKSKKIKEIKENMNLELDLGIDSLNRVELASNLLDIFKIENAPMEEIAQLLTVEQVINFILKYYKN